MTLIAQRQQVPIRVVASLSSKEQVVGTERLPQVAQPTLVLVALKYLSAKPLVLRFP
jgi:hypothetical protein